MGVMQYSGMGKRRTRCPDEPLTRYLITAKSPVFHRRSFTNMFKAHQISGTLSSNIRLENGKRSCRTCNVSFKLQRSGHQHRTEVAVTATSVLTNLSELQSQNVQMLLIMISDYRDYCTIDHPCNNS